MSSEEGTTKFKGQLKVKVIRAKSTFFQRIISFFKDFLL